MPRDREKCPMPSMGIKYLQALSVEPQATRVVSEHPCLTLLRLLLSEQGIPSKHSAARG